VSGASRGTPALSEGQRWLFRDSASPGTTTVLRPGWRTQTADPTPQAYTGELTRRVGRFGAKRENRRSRPVVFAVVTEACVHGVSTPESRRSGQGPPAAGHLEEAADLLRRNRTQLARTASSKLHHSAGREPSPHGRRLRRGELPQEALLAFRCSCGPVEQLCKVDTAAVT
jgi:hypothetical protein